MPIGPAQARQRRLGLPEVLDHALRAARRCCGGCRWRRRRRRRCSSASSSARSSSLGSCVSATTQLRRSGLKASTTSSGMSLTSLAPGTSKARAVLLARVADGHGEAAEQGHGRQVLGQLAGADQQHAVLGAEGVGHAALVDRQFRRRIGRFQRRRAIGQAHGAPHQPAAFEQRDQLGQAGGIRIVFEQQFERAAAGQAEAVRLVGGDAVLHQRGRPRRHLLARCSRPA